MVRGLESRCLLRPFCAVSSLPRLLCCRSPLKRQCANWDASGQLIIIQRFSKYENNLTLEQKGNVLTGTAYTFTPTSGVISDGYKSLNGTVDGTLDGDRFSVQIFWVNRLTGVYNGKVLPSGRLDGEAYEKASPNSRQTWYSKDVLKCPPPPPKVLRTTGKVRKSEPAPPMPPFITASEPVVIQPSIPFASVYVGWDGGPDHPNVEVWLSIDNAIESPASSMDFAQQSSLWKLPKGGTDFRLLRNHHYKFVLRGSGKTLSTVDFVVR